MIGITECKKPRIDTALIHAFPDLPSFDVGYNRCFLVQVTLITYQGEGGY